MPMPTARLGPIAIALAALLAAAVLRAEEPPAELKDLRETTAALYRAGDYAGALRLAERALPLVIRQYGSEHEQTGIHYYALGLVSEATGKLSAAEGYFQRSLQIREKVYGPDSAATADTLQRLGTLYVKMGKYDAAEPALARALKIRQALTGADHAFTASSQADLGSLALARGDWLQALSAYREAIRLITGQDTSATFARSLVEQDIARLHEAFVGLSRATWELRAAPGRDAAALREEAYLAGQLAWTTAAGSAIAKMTARLGAGKTELASRVRRLQDLTERILSLHAEDAKLLGDWSARTRADPTYSALLEGFRAASIARGRDSAPGFKRQRELVAELTALLQRCPPGQRKAGCEAADSGREAISRELAALSAASRAGADELMALNARMTAAERALPGYDEFARARPAVRDDIDRSERDAHEARAAIERAFPPYAALAEPKPLTVAATQALLAGDEALLAILVGAQHSFVWAVTRERAVWAQIDVGRDALADEVAALRRGLDPLAADGDRTPGVVGAFDLAAAHALYRRVLGPVAESFAAKGHLIIVPSGPLTSLPFQVLLTEPAAKEGGRPSAEDLRDAPWLIKRHALSVLPSVPALSALRALSPGAPPSRPFFGIGDPILKGPDEEQRQRGKPRTPVAAASFYRNGLADIRAVRELAPLPETAEELRSIARVLGAPPEAVVLGEAATESAVKAAPLHDYRIVQFATHGLVAGELSGLAEPALVLTPPDTPSEADDGLLTASEIATLRLNADWVVLSACNTAAGSREGAEALSGLARAFFYAGARALLVSHWAVFSSAATALTTRTFAVLAASPGLGRARALRQAMLELIDQGEAPGYWAPFVVVGEAGSVPRHD
jgi:CHAT domain-containing protein/tetratricopeptide (TPR) repeat protein